MNTEYYINHNKNSFTGRECSEGVAESTYSATINQSTFKLANCPILKLSCDNYLLRRVVVELFDPRIMSLLSVPNHQSTRAGEIIALVGCPGDESRRHVDENNIERFRRIGFCV